MDEPVREADLPAALRWAVRLLLGEAVVVGAVAAFLLYADLTSPAINIVAALFITAFAAAAAATLAALARALGRRRGGARGLSVVLQLMILPIGYYTTTGDLPWDGIPIMMLALGVCGLLLSPASTRALELGG
ncbi:MAG TPA: hypothetical protein VES42_19565 [Pilimelia sp.]|nr:hypothetical protein [Pilimelia sp.]